MARLIAATGKADKGLRGTTRNAWRVAGLVALVASGSGWLSGCAGLATNSSASPTAQETVQITPSIISFANVAVGQKAMQTATLTNTGSESVTVSQMAVSSSQFAATGLATPLSLGPGQSAKFQITYVSSTSGTSSGTLTAMTAHGGSSTRVKLNGSAARAASQLSLSTTNLNYGNVLVKGSSTQAVTVKNSGVSDVQISQIGLTGAGYSINGIATPVTVPAGQSVALQATFAPTVAGTASGGITISSDATNPTASVGLSGNGVAATYTMSLSPTSISFGNVNVGSSATQNVQLSNTGNSSVNVTQVAASGTGISVSGVATPFTLGPSQSAMLTVKFIPTAGGSSTGGVTVTNDQAVSVAAAVTGSGAQAGLSVTPTSASFASVVTGNTNSQTIQLKNSGTANLTISQATVSGSGFSLSGLALPLTLIPGQSGNFNVQFAPQAGGNLNGTVSIASNAANSPATIALSGTGVAATYTITVNPGSLSFGTVTDGNSATQSFTVTNTGNSNVAISGMAVTGTGYSLASGSGSVTLAPNQSTAVSVQFAPTAAGTASGSVNILSNATGSTSSVALSGSGAAPSVQHSASLSWGASTSSVAGYNVYRSTVSGSAYVRVNSSLVGGMNFSDSSVQSGMTYFYVATAVDTGGTESVYSNEVAAIVP